MVQIPSLDWPRRISALNGAEDLLKQNPSSDPSPQEERIPVALVSDFTIDQISLTSVGTGVSIIKGKFAEDFQFNSITNYSSRITVSLSSDTIFIDANATSIANSIVLSDIGDVVDTPGTDEFLKFNGSGWVTVPLVSEFFLTDGSATETVDGTNNSITFQSTSNITFSVLSTNVVQAAWTANLTDIADMTAPSNSNQVLIWDGAAYDWAEYDDVIGSGVTNGVNIGANGYGVFSDKLGSYLRFRNIADASSKINVSLGGSDIFIDAVPSNIAAEINLVDLADVDGTPANGDILMFNGTTWENVSGLSGGVALQIYEQNYLFNTFDSLTYLRLYGDGNITTSYNTSNDMLFSWTAVLGDLSDVTPSSPINGQALIYSSGTSSWSNSDIKFNLTGNSGTQIIKNNETMRMLGSGGIRVQVTNPDTALIILDASITDLNDIGSPSSANTVLFWDGLNYIWVDENTVGGGETNTASNVGTLGYGVFNQKTGVNFEFRNISGNSSKIEVVLDGNNNITIDADALEIANEIRLQDLFDVVNAPTTNGYLKYDGTNWISELVSPSFSFEIQADGGINIDIVDGLQYIISGDDEFIATYNNITGSTYETIIDLNIDAVADAIDVEDLGNVFGNPSVNDTLAYDGMKFVFQALPTTILSNAWLLGGNNEPSEYSLGTLNAYDIPIVANAIQVGKIKVGGKLGWGVNNPLSTIDINGSIGPGNVVTKVNNYVVTDNDYVILVDAQFWTVTVTLPDATNCYRREHIIKKIDSTLNAVTISSVSNIDGATSYVIAAQYDSIKVKSDGTQWWVI